MVNSSGKIGKSLSQKTDRPSGMQKILVLDASQRSALAIIRNLSRHGLSPVVGDHVPKTIGSASRHATASVLYPDPAMSPSAFIDEISAIVRRLGIDTVIPVTDLTTMLLTSQRNLLQSAKLTCADARSYEVLSDKVSLLELAAKMGVPAPDTRIARTAGEIVRAARDFGFPLVLKPARSRYLKAGKVISTSVRTLGAPDQLSATIKELDWLGDLPCLVQRFIPGHGAGIFTLYGPGGPIAWFAHRRIREKPPTGGVSVLSESVQIDSEMQSAAAKILSAVGWIGVAMVEFRVTGEGTPYLMEVNGRFWGSLQLSIDCGIDFPWLLYRVVHGLPIEPLKPYALGRRLRWLLGDLDSLAIELRRSESHLIHKAKAISAFLCSFADTSCRQETFRLSDPWPGIREATLWLNSLYR